MSAEAPLDREELFDAAFLDRLRLLALRLRKRKQLLRKGYQSTPATGMTREFKDYRHYARGEDYRGIDWRLYARLEKLFVRLYEETQELSLHILVDTSVSMAQPHAEKRKQTLRFAVALAYLGLSGQQRVSLYSMSSTVRAELPPLRGQGNIEKIIQAVSALRFSGVTDLEQSFADFHPSRQRTGLVFVLSDFYGKQVGSATAALNHAVAWPGEVHFIHMLHPEERVPRLEGEMELTEVETGEQRRFWLTAADVERYTAVFDSFCTDLSTSCAGRQVDYSQCWATEPFEERFLALLTRSAALSST